MSAGSNRADGLVTQALWQQVAKQVEDHGLVVWYDPEGHYASVASRLSIAKTTVVCYNGSFLQLRREIGPLLNDLHPPRLVVYVPMEQAGTDHALIELEAAGVVVQPGQQPPNRNTRLSLVARNALRPLRGDANAAEIEKQVEAGKLTLADLDVIGEKKDSGVLSLIFGSGNPQEVALGFLASCHSDGEVEKKSATGELADLLRSTLEVDLPGNAPLVEMRDRLARHVLLTDLVAGLGESLPASLNSLKVAASPAQRDACVVLARSWRLRRDVRDSYVTAARKFQQESSLGQVEFVTGTIAQVETFPCLERALLRHVEEALLEGANTDLLDLATSCQSRFWSEVTPTIQAHWALLAAAEVLLEADRVATALKDAPKTVAGLVHAYAEGESSLVPARYAPSPPGEPVVQLRPGRCRPASGARQADPESRAAVHGGRLPVGEGVRNAVLQGQAPDRRSVASGAGLRDSGDASSRQGQDGLRLG